MPGKGPEAAVRADQRRQVGRRRDRRPLGQIQVQAQAERRLGRRQAQGRAGGRAIHEQGGARQQPLRVAPDDRLIDRIGVAEIVAVDDQIGRPSAAPFPVQAILGTRNLAQN